MTGKDQDRDQDRNRDQDAGRTRTGSGPDITDNANANMAPKGLEKPGRPGDSREDGPDKAPKSR